MKRKTMFGYFVRISHAKFNQKKKKVCFQLPEESLLNNGNIPPFLEEDDPLLATILDNVSDDKMDEEIVVEFPPMLDIECTHNDIFNSGVAVDDVACIVSISMCDDTDKHDVDFYDAFELDREFIFPLL